MLNKILLALGVLVTISALGSALTCNKCYYTSAMAKAKRNCASSTTVSCSTGYCYTATYTLSSGMVVADRDCDKSSDRYCPDPVKTCSDKAKQDNLKLCLGACCKTDNCNNFTPSSSAGGVVATKFIMCFTVFAGFLFA